MWWSCNAFIPLVASGLAGVEAVAQGLAPEAATALKEDWKATATNAFNLGGLIGTLLTVPLAKVAGRKVMFAIYFAASAAAILAAFGLPMPPATRLWMYFPIGLTVFGVFGSFTYYLPELYPTRLRATGAGFCYNAGRVFAALGPFLVGAVASRGADSLQTALQVLFWVGAVPLVGLLLVPFIEETRDRALAD
jgi:MFS family permease